MEDENKINKIRKDFFLLEKCMAAQCILEILEREDLCENCLNKINKLKTLLVDYKIKHVKEILCLTDLL